MYPILMPSYSIYLPNREDGLLASAIESTEYGFGNESQAIQYAIRQTYGDTTNE